MKITDVRVRRLENNGKMKAVVSVTFENVLVVHDIKIIEGQKGLFIAMPSRKIGESDYIDIAHPITTEMRDTLEKAIFSAYEKVKELSDHVNI